MFPTDTAISAFNGLSGNAVEPSLVLTYENKEVMIRLMNGESIHKQSPIKNQPEGNRELLTFSTLVFFLSLCFFNTADAQATNQSGYSLVGTIQSRNFSGAVIIAAKGEQSFLKIFEKLPDGSQIVRVRDDSISLRGADGTLYDMFISHERVAGSAVSPPSANYNASEPAPTYVGPSPAQQEVINRIKRRALERAQRRKNEDE